VVRMDEGKRKVLHSVAMQTRVSSFNLRGDCHDASVSGNDIKCVEFSKKALNRDKITEKFVQGEA